MPAIDPPGRGQLVDQGARPGQAADRADRAGDERHLQSGEPAQHRLLRHHAAGIGDGRDHAEDDADQVGLGAAGGHPDEHDTGEGHGDAGDQPAREALPQQQAGEDRDQDRADVDQHRRRAGVQMLLGGVERDVVDAEPAHAADGEQAHSRRFGRTQPRPASSRPRTAVPTSNRPRASAPGEKSAPTPRIATNADAQAKRVTTTATRVRADAAGAREQAVRR